MPIEIFELVIKAKINEPNAQADNQSNSASGQRSNPLTEKKVMDRVLELMKRKKER